MPSLNWDPFINLPGDANHNFEYLCRDVIRRTYAKFGKFEALANQSGVEFHIKLNKEAPVLGSSGRWWGWQCKWFDLTANGQLRSAQKVKIIESLEATKKYIPELTDWVLWTKRPLARTDKGWFDELQEKYTFSLHSWSDELADLLNSGDCVILREAYFGELILTPDILANLHRRSVEEIRQKWLPDVHCVFDAETCITESLGRSDVWKPLLEYNNLILEAIDGMRDAAESLSLSSLNKVHNILSIASERQKYIEHIVSDISTIDLDILPQYFETISICTKDFIPHIKHFRGRNSKIAVYLTNLRGYLEYIAEILADMKEALSIRIYLITAEAGGGKTQFSAEISKPTSDYDAGILLHGINFKARISVNDLVGGLNINSKRLNVFEELVEALNAHGMRTRQRIPIVIDALNESEDPRVWKLLLAQINIILEKYPCVMLVVTVRPDFINDVKPISEITILEMEDSDDYSDELIAKYFEYYKIDPIDANVNSYVLKNLLTLRVFCEATNANRLEKVGVERIPRNHAEVFRKYIDNILAGITDTAPLGSRCAPFELEGALYKLGEYLWTNHTRSISHSDLETLFDDKSKSWEQKILRQFISSGILLRNERDSIAFAYDHLAGYIIADYVYKAYGHKICKWLADNFAILDYDSQTRHPLFSDILVSLTGIVLLENPELLLWQVVSGKMQQLILLHSIMFNGLIAEPTVQKIRDIITLEEPWCVYFLDALRYVRAAVGQSFNSIFLHDCLNTMTMSCRDLRWSELIRKRKEGVIDDLIKFREYWKNDSFNMERAELLALWSMWTLTSTVCEIRDQATKTLAYFGRINPARLFEMTIQSLSINDPYIPERMLAASYGLVLSCLNDPVYFNIRSELPNFAKQLYTLIFMDNAPYSTKHYLLRDYALGIIYKAFIVCPELCHAIKSCDIIPPYHNTKNYFAEPDTIDAACISETRLALHMDFRNYTIGGLILNRRNYDENNLEYIAVVQQIQQRMHALGYTITKFGEIDKNIGSGIGRLEGRTYSKIERYGKKYSWIAYYEMFGLKSDLNLLPEWKQERFRISDADIDPSFPVEPMHVTLDMPTPFTPEFIEHIAWLRDGPIPDYDHLLINRRIDSNVWLMLYGTIILHAISDKRRIETYIRGILVKNDVVSGVLLAGKRFISFDDFRSLPAEHYVFAGEMLNPRYPDFTKHFTYCSMSILKDVTARRHNRLAPIDIEVEMPAIMHAWEYYHSTLNQISGVMIPSPTIINSMDLRNMNDTWDLFDSNGNRATVYQSLDHDRFTPSDLLYIRADILSSYLKQNNLCLLWTIWGMRDIARDGSDELPANILSLYRNEKNEYSSNKLLDNEACSIITM